MSTIDKESLGIEYSVQREGIEILRTIFPSIIPMFIAIPSFALLYSMGGALSPLSAECASSPSVNGSSSTGWTSLLGSTSQEPSVVPSPSGVWTHFEHAANSPGSSTSVNPPIPAEQAVPPQPPAPLIPHLHHPLLSDQERSYVLYSRSALLNLGKNDGFINMNSIISNQVIVERSIEAALVDDGFHPLSILRRYADIRHFLHSPKGELLSERTYSDYVSQIREQGTRESVPYRRVIQAVRSSHLLLERADGGWI